jgi:hypothetical protein
MRHEDFVAMETQIVVLWVMIPCSLASDYEKSRGKRPYFISVACHLRRVTRLEQFLACD